MEEKQTANNKQMAQINAQYVEKIKGTPFTIIKVVDETQEVKSQEVISHSEQFKIALGRQIVSGKTFKTADAATRYVNSKPWELIFQIIYTLQNEKTN